MGFVNRFCGFFAKKSPNRFWQLGELVFLKRSFWVRLIFLWFAKVFFQTLVYSPENVDPVIDHGLLEVQPIWIGHDF